MTAELEKQVVAALADDTLSAASLGELVATLEVAITEAERTATGAYTAFLDPIMTPSATEGRAACERTRFAADRLKTLLPKLQAKYRAVEAGEDRQEWQIDFTALAEERNSLAKELKSTYPAAVAALVNLFARVADLDHRIGQLHGSRPSGAKRFLLGAESTARGLEAFTRDQPSLTRSLALPSFPESSKLAFPPPAASAGLLIASATPTDHPRYSRDWHKAEDTARRKSEEQQLISQETERQAESRRAYESR